MNYKNIITNTIITAVLLTGFFLLTEKNKDKIAYIKLGKVYEGFQMKKDLEKKFGNIQEARKSNLDSLELELGLIYKKLTSTSSPSHELLNTYEVKKEKYFTKKQQFNEDNNKVVEQYTDQIMKKINEYVDGYGKDRGYTFILGADGNGTIMHAEDVKDVTDDVLKFINSSYNGNGK